MTGKIPAYKIAKLANVSPSTISRILNNKKNVNPETAKEVKKIIYQLGLEKLRDETKIIILNLNDISNVFYQEIIEGVRSAVIANNCKLLIDQTEITDENVEEYVDFLKKHKIYGIIILKQLSREILKEIAKNIRIVQCNEFNPKVNLPYVTIDDYSAAKTATEKLISLNKQKIGLINGPRSFRYARERERGFRDALKENGINANEDWILSLPVIKYDIALPIVDQIFSTEYYPEAFFCISDTFGAAVVTIAKKHKLKMPEDLSIIGFDDTIFSQIISPPITTVSQPKFKIGYSAVELLEKYDLKKEHIILGTKLIMRKTT